MADRRNLDPAPPARRPATAAAAPPEPELGGPGPARDPEWRDTHSTAPGLRLLVTPDTILRWHRDIIGRRRAARSMRRRTGRPATRRNIRALVLRLARENPGWGYRRIHGELAGLGVKIAASTAWEILNKAGIDPAPRRTGPTWPQFLRSQAEAILACDFFTAGLLDGTQAYVPAVIEHATRRIRILGVTVHPTGEWTAQQARNLLLDLGEQAHRVKFMIGDRGPIFTAAFNAVLAGARDPDRAVQRPDAADERDRRTLDRRMPARAPGPHPDLEPAPPDEGAAGVRDHHNWRRPHWSLDGAAPLKPPPEPVDLEQYRIRRKTRVGGLINEYHLVG